MKSVLQAFQKKRYLFLFVSMTGLLVIPSFMPSKFITYLMHFIFLSLVIVSTAFIIKPQKKRYKPLLALMVVALVSNWADYSLDGQIQYGAFRLFSVLFLMFFFLGQVMRSIFRSKSITIETVFASLNGYLIMGIIGGFLFRALAFFQHQPLSVYIPNEKFMDYFYFSFCTLTTIGYGDISPITQQAKVISMVLGIAGQLYLAVVIGIIIGKYIMHSEERKMEQILLENKDRS